MGVDGSRRTDAETIAPAVVDVALIGAGPAGLTAAAAIRRVGGDALRVTIFEREREAGGIPRHAWHQGFGLRDLHRSLNGPAYAARLREAALDAGVELRLGSQVTGWGESGDDLRLSVTSADGVGTVRARAVVLATGCRERPRSARLVAGSRPAGVMTTGTLQQLVYLERNSPGTRAVVVGAEHVSFSAVATLAHAGAATVAITTELPRHQSYAAFRWGAALRYRAPLLTSTVLTAIQGRERVESVTVRDLRTGLERSIACDTVVFTGDWVPDHELASLGGLELQAGSLGPRVDGLLRTQRPGLFAAGNVLHGAETADIAALSGRRVAASVLSYLGDEAWPTLAVPLVCEPPLHWISPGAVVPGPPATPPRGRYLVRAHEELLDARLELSQGRRVLSECRLARVTAGRSASLPIAWTACVDPDDGPVFVRVTRARRRR
jgi:NADPH-dependent 2,4-dienoyl-CoA reductase/sulfur reductase-like enzyme